jgi:pimeloyl-ACP methyl ester carboxylesterase
MMLFRAGLIGLATLIATAARADSTEAVRPFHANIPKAALVDLKKRIASTRWPERETVGDRSQGAQLAKLQALAAYWGGGYDWRKAEAKLNALPQFVTTIDGVDIHFIHVRSRHPNAMPLIMTHGWPGSIFELLKTVGPLTDPTAHGGSAEDAFDVVLPSMPGYGFSGKPQGTGWNPDRIARAWDVLMKRLGYDHYIAQGGDWGAIVTDSLGRQAPPGLLGIHVNRVDKPSTLPPEVSRALRNGEPAPSSLNEDEKTIYAELDAFNKTGAAYAAIMGTRPQTIGYGLDDSPVGLAAFIYDKFADWTFFRGEPEKALTREEMLDDITFYWFTNTGASSARLYWESTAAFMAVNVSIPAAITVFPGEVYRPPRAWAERAYHKLIYYHAVEKGGHFAAWEQPELFAAELRAAFKPLRESR